MALSSGPSVYSKYPWNYTTGELSSLFGISRSEQIMASSGSLVDSGIVEAVKMLQGQLRYLTVIPYYRSGRFSGINGSIANLFSADPVVFNLDVTGITHSIVNIEKARDWIDAIRYDYGLAAWSWSSAIQSSEPLKIDHIKELWRATGVLVKQTIGSPEDVCAFTMLDWQNAPPPGVWIHDYYDLIFGASVHYAQTGGGYWNNQRPVFQFPASTTSSNLNCILLFRLAATAAYTGNDTIHFALPIDSSWYPPKLQMPWTDPVYQAKLENLFITEGSATGTFQPVSSLTGDDTGLNGSYQFCNLAGLYPVESGWEVWIRAQLTTEYPYVQDSNWFKYIHENDQYPILLWQPEITNPY